MNERPKGRPRLTLIVNERMESQSREKARRRAELQQFIRACEALYEKNKQEEIQHEETYQEKNCNP